MRERALLIGEGQNLVGVLCEPEPAKKIAGAPAVLLWNVGIHHRVGPYRVFTDLARRLAAEGFTSLRFDVAGQGDSAPRRGVVEGNAHVADVKEAMAFLEKKLGFKAFVPAAFCSGVDACHLLSVSDERVVGVIYIEPYAWRTPGFWVRYPLRFLDAARWKRRLANKQAAEEARGDDVALDPLAQEAAQKSDAAAGIVFSRGQPDRMKFGAEVAALAARGARLLFLYFGGDTNVNHAGQLWQMIGRSPGELGGKVEVVFDARADHILYRPGDRARALDAMVAWTRRHFPPGVSPEPGVR
ncbi:MAG TPA: alpha/beta hydrolase [Myxococcales bacterium]|nr:alpha/beta hydrolase [Myxococcales bacterium]